MRADEAAVLRELRPSKTHIYVSKVYASVISDLIEDGLAECVCDAIAKDPKAVRALLRRAKEIGPT